MLISVIVPVYNVEKYINRCIRSIVNQSYKNIEIILVDDGSSDKSGLICDEFGNIDNRIKVIHKSNGGLSDARNTGIEEARGQALCFVDSDDFLNSRMIEILHRDLIDNNADIAVCDYQCFENDREIIQNIEESQVVLYTDAGIKELLKRRESKTVIAWNKMYRREIFETYRYPKGRYHEDQWAVHHILLSVNRIVYTDAKLYYYYQREDSITQSIPNTKRIIDLIEALEDSAQCYKEHGLNALQLTAACNAANCCLFYYEEVGKKYDGDCRQVRDKIKEKMKKIINSNQEVLSIKQMPCFIFPYFPAIAVKTNKIIHWISNRRRLHNI